MRGGRPGARTSRDRHPSRRERNVSGKVYDPLPGDGQPPLGVDEVSIEPMDPAGVELLAADLLELLEWAREDRCDD